jgi:hypothetical protein
VHDAIEAAKEHFASKEEAEAASARMAGAIAEVIAPAGAPLAV